MHCVWVMAMSLTVFLAICILGCDVLIYFLYEWAFGESERIRKRRAVSRFGVNSGKGTEAPARVVEINRERQERNARPQPNSYSEAMAYRRLAASFGQLKPRI